MPRAPPRPQKGYTCSGYLLGVRGHRIDFTAYTAVEFTTLSKEMTSNPRAIDNSAASLLGMPLERLAKISGFDVTRRDAHGGVDER